MMKLNKTDEAVVKTLKAEGKNGLSLQEIADKSGQPPKKVFKSLKKLFEHEMVDTQARKYTLLTDKVPTGKDAEAAESDDEEE
ncbi:MAG: hypothetical protein ACQCN5_01980 [Candidatus Bathyarchaeia archaeon]|jgi:DNA-binding IclR family transcriptional regulator